MEIPIKCTVLVIGGGPAGSYASAVLAREGIDVVCLEADVFPRYHIGESMLPSIRHFLRFIELDQKFDAHGFKPKKGAMFRLNSRQPPVYTDFVAAGGPNGYAWNVVRSESDEMMFRHAGESGAKVFDGVRVGEVEFDKTTAGATATLDSNVPELGRPVSASWSRKSDGTSGSIEFQYLIDASGRAGIFSTKYMKNRKYNQGLKNVASWGYWKNMQTYGVGTPAEGQPYFEALEDASGWVWTIPLSDTITSVGVVQNQDVATQKKRAMGSPTSKEFYTSSIKEVPGIEKLLVNAEMTSDSVKSASDWSYSASSYATPYTRVAGDAGCFIDPFFSSGVHLALASGLSAAVTICASIKNELDERTAAKWHSKKVAEGYTRFLLVVLSALKQIRKGDQPVLADFDEESFDRAFALFRPIIQGTVDTGSKLTQGEISKTVEFCLQAFRPGMGEDRSAAVEKFEALKRDNPDTAATAEGLRALEEKLSESEQSALAATRAQQMLRTEDSMNLDTFSTDVIDGMAPRLVCGQLGLIRADQVVDKGRTKIDLLATMTNDTNGEDEKTKEPVVSVDEVKAPGHKSGLRSAVS